MAKSKYKIEIESWIVLVIAAVIFAVALTNKLIPKLNISQFFVAPTSSYGEYPFSFSNPLSYMRILFHIFGSFSIVSIACCLCLISFVPNAERDFGTIPLIAMILLSTFFSGVLSACFSKNAISGVEPIFYLLIFLNIFGGLKKKKIMILHLAAFAVLVTWSLVITDKPDFIAVLVQIAGGLCGSLISFLTVPKAGGGAKSKLKSKKEKKSEPKSDAWYDNEDESPRFKKNNSGSDSDDSTVIGTLTL